MRHIITILLTLLMLAPAAARTVTQAPKSARRTVTISKPDLEEIKRETLDPKSKFYFPKLFDRYQKKDTVMTPEEYRHLYLGYMFQEDYDPYRESPFQDEVNSLREKQNRTRVDDNALVTALENSLYNNPFDLRSMSMLVHILKEQGKNMKANIWEYRLENLLAAIKSTGTGENADNAWFVIYPAHEYDMAQLLGYNAVDVDFDTYPGYDVLKVEPEQGNKSRKPMTEMFFNVVVPTQQFEAKHPEDLE